MLDTILFDLDGTLLPFSEEEFVNCYFAKLADKLAPYGYEKKSLTSALWGGTKAMVKNDGAQTNREVFWKQFYTLIGEGAQPVEHETQAFYANEFDSVSVILKEKRHLEPMIRALREKGYTVALATNPIFPAVGVRTRLGWVGLTPEDFAYVTSYENSYYAKPNTKYYEGVLAAIGKTAEQCVMIGNNPVEDGAAMKLGINTVLISDDMEGAAQIPDGAELMSFAELPGYLDALPKLN